MHQKDILEKMTETLLHRGPDAFGTWISPRAALVHRRLIVVDPKEEFNQLYAPLEIIHM